MSLSCGCDDDGGYVELDPDFMDTAPNTIICRECGHLISPGADYYRIRSWNYDEYGDEIDIGIREVCEGCGDLAYTILELGYCYMFGSLRHDVREFAALQRENYNNHIAWKTRQKQAEKLRQERPNA